MRSSSARAVALVALAAAVGPRPVWAAPEDNGLAERLLYRPHTTVELEAGIIALPSAPISPVNQGGNTPFGRLGKGDATLMTGFHLLFRGGAAWAIGAGALLGPRPTSDNIGTAALPRTHSRSYLWVGAEGRYIPIHYKWIEAWIGATAGGILVADRYDNNTYGVNTPFVGPWNINEVTVRTEGFSFGPQIGVDWTFAESFAIGLAVRGDWWILPNQQECSPLQECATLRGSVAAFEGGLTFGYRLPL
jgi:hypothetical protein